MESAVNINSGMKNAKSLVLLIFLELWCLAVKYNIKDVAKNS